MSEAVVHSEALGSRSHGHCGMLSAIVSFRSASDSLSLYTASQPLPLHDV